MFLTTRCWKTVAGQAGVAVLPCPVTSSETPPEAWIPSVRNGAPVPEGLGVLGCHAGSQCTPQSRLTCTMGSRWCAGTPHPLPPWKDPSGPAPPPSGVLG